MHGTKVKIVVESVYNAVRADSLYKADYVSFLKGILSTVLAQFPIQTYIFI
jgi:hypothetical protein